MLSHPPLAHYRYHPAMLVLGKKEVWGDDAATPHESHPKEPLVRMILGCVGIQLSVQQTVVVCSWLLVTPTQ